MGIVFHCSSKISKRIKESEKGGYVVIAGNQEVDLRNHNNNNNITNSVEKGVIISVKNSTFSRENYKDTHKIDRL